MISNSERQFINHWNEQKSGPLWKYYLLFTIAWSVVAFILIFFLSKIFTDLWETGGRYLIVVMIAMALIIGFVSTHITYRYSEKKYKLIMKKKAEMDLGS